MENFDASLSTYFKALLGPRDTRVKGWFLLDNYIPTLICSIIYLLIVWLGPKYMKNRQAFSCRGILVVYNIGLTLLSLYMFYELVTGVWEGKYNFFCQDTRSAGEADMKIIRVLWWYYFSKLIEFMDTFFFILRKNNHQITILHVYHHATMLNIWWFVMNWVPCGHLHHSGAAASVCADNRPDQLRGHLAVSIPSWLVIFPDWIHDFSDYSLHKLLHSDLQQERGLPEERAPEGTPERVCGCCEWTHQQLFHPGKQHEAEEATEGLKSELKASKPRRLIVSTMNCADAR
ncbi:PREDICTED: elongation of very long chain fatty acids protein 5 isoform X2 [Condylura cristata]|uniref:elongation of very long chain fatty acids protein 5 isoform X2 n=1 Tax=Condylura cristata TaxID=143302 RepID=UPI000642C5DB|nr:PREDICTED: elongation of very long chain fatty acids protein 5 isoform X2 [Condylura cristata]